jgi:hypothetical protein
MKKQAALYWKIQLLSFIVITFAFLSPVDLFGQKGKGGSKSNDIYIVLSCTEYIGDGKYWPILDMRIQERKPL